MARAKSNGAPLAPGDAVDAISSGFTDWEAIADVPGEVDATALLLAFKGTVNEIVPGAEGSF